MNLLFLYLALFIFAMGVAACAFLYAGYSWGRFAAVQALNSHAAKWQAYLLALLPPIIFAATFKMDISLAPLAAQAFFGLAAPATIGVCLSYGAGIEER